MPQTSPIPPNDNIISLNNSQPPEITADAWFAEGRRLPYDQIAKEIVQSKTPANPKDIVHVFTRVIKERTSDSIPVWASFLSGWPDGSFGWAKVDRALAGKNIGPRLFFDYVGHGDSDKPADYSFSNTERADMVEAMWKSEDIKSTFIYSFDYSSIVTMELLARQQDRLDAGEELTTRIEGVVLINGGLYVDGHTHPWYTTPILKSWMGGFATSIAQHSKPVFAEIMKPLWSKNYKVTPEEIDQMYSAISRRNGVYSLSKSADFLKDHLQNPDRLNLSRLFRHAKDQVSFHIVGSAEDPFEGRQAVLAQERLGAEGLDVRILPGGHLSTSEHPERLAQIIEEVTLLNSRSSAVETAAGSSL